MGYEFIDTQTASDSTDFATFTFADAVDFADYSEMYCSFQFGTTGTSDIGVLVGDTSEGGVLTGTYDKVKSDNNDGTYSNEYSSGQAEWSIATHPRLDPQNGCSGYVRVFLIRDSSDDTFLSFQSFAQGFDSWWLAGGKNTTTQDDLKYFRLFYGADRNIAGSNVTCYKLARS